jgi:hypothetical protein
VFEEVQGGASSKDKAMVFNTLSGVLKKADNVEPAAEFCLKGISMLKDIDGDMSGQIAIGYLNLAGLYVRMGRGDDAVNSCVNCVQIRKALLGNSHPLVKSPPPPAFFFFSNLFSFRCLYFFCFCHFK